MALTPTCYYPCHESSGNFVDAADSSDLTDNNGCGTGSGPLSLARTFSRASNQFGSNTGANGKYDISGVDWSWAGWVKFASFGTTQGLWSRRGAHSPFSFYKFSNDKLICDFRDDTTEAAGTTVLSSTTTWYWTCVVFTESTKNLVIYLGSGGSISTEGNATAAADIIDGGTMRLGSYDGNSGTALDGAMGEVFWSPGYALTSADRTFLYGSGTPPSYPYGGATTAAQLLSSMGCGR